MLIRKIIAIDYVTHTKQDICVGKIQNFLVLLPVVHTTVTSL